MASKKFGYARVSTKEQNLDRQIKILLDEGIDDRDIYTDKQSGKSFVRESYRYLVDRVLREGDTIVVTELKRFGRNYREIYEEWHLITKVIKAQIKVTSMPILDTSQSQELIGQVITDVVLAMFAYIAEEDYQERRETQRQGIENAQAKGIRCGRPSTEFPDVWDEYYNKWRQGDITAREAMRRMDLKKSSFYKLVKEFEANN